MAVICASCLTPSRDGAKFCKSCGGRLSAVAPNAGLAANQAPLSEQAVPTAAVGQGIAGSAASPVAPSAGSQRSAGENLADSPHRAVSVRPAAALAPVAGPSALPPVDQPVRSTRAEATRPSPSTDEWPVTELLLSDPVPLEPTAAALDSPSLGSRAAFEPSDALRPSVPANAAREVRSQPKRVGAAKASSVAPPSAWPRIGAIAAVLMVVGVSAYLFNTKDDAPSRPPSAPIAIAPPIEPAASPATAPVAARLEGPASPPPLLQGAALPVATPTAPAGREALVAGPSAEAPFLPGPASAPRVEPPSGSAVAEATPAKPASVKPSAASARQSRKTPPSAPSTAAAVPPPTVQPVQVSLPVAPAEPPPPVDPTVACAGRGFFARSRCLVDQCAQAVSRSHAQCEAVRQQQQIDEEKRNPSLAG